MNGVWMRSMVIVSTAVAVAFSGARAYPAEVGGIVVDETGAPVPGARFCVLTMATMSAWEFELAAEVETGRNGRFSLTLDEPVQMETTIFAVRHPDYGLAWTMSKFLTRRGENLSDFRMVLPKGASVQGKVTDSEGNPVESAVLSAFVTPPEGAAYSDAGFLPLCEPLLRATSGTDGTFILDGLPADASVVLRVKHPDFAADLAGAPEDVRGMPDGEIAVGTKDVTVRLESGATIEGRITFEETGEPAERAVVQAKPMQYDFAALLIGPMKTETDMAGRYVLRGLAAFTYSVEVTHPEGTAAPVTVGVVAGMHVTDQDITIGRGVLVSGKLVYAETGAPV